jgi:peroxiredoxin
VAQDNGYGTWSAYRNQEWPATYLIDAEGRIVYQHYGEGRYKETEAEIQKLLAQRKATGVQ